MNGGDAKRHTDPRGGQRRGKQGRDVPEQAEALEPNGQGVPALEYG